MAKCVRCGKFSLFKSYPNGICDYCEKKIIKEQEEREFQEYQERRRREMEEEARIAKEEDEKRRLKESITLPDNFWGRALTYKYEEVSLFVPDESMFSRMGIGTKLNAFRDPDNPYDKNAVRLEWNSDILAYFYRGKLQDMANDYLKVGSNVHGVVTRLMPEEKKIQASIGFYKGSEHDTVSSYLLKHPNAKKYKLTGCSSAERQDNIMFSHVGEECALEYDYDKEKYMVTAGDELGYLSAAAGKLVDESGEENCSVFIAEIDTNDSGKYFASVYLFFE